MKEIKNKLTILIKNILIAGSFLLLGFLIGCEDTYYEKEPFIMSWDARLPIDDNGYYHLEMNRNTWQTTHRISGVVSDENVMVNWESNLYWVLNDTLGYIVKRQFSDWNGQYVSMDTSYITGFEGMEVPTTNRSSYSNKLGEINNMIAPVKNMVGDTLMLGAFWTGGEAFFGIILK